MYLRIPHLIRCHPLRKCATCLILKKTVFLGVLMNEVVFHSKLSHIGSSFGILTMTRARIFTLLSTTLNFWVPIIIEMNWVSITTLSSLGMSYVNFSRMPNRGKHPAPVHGTHLARFAEVLTKPPLTTLRHYTLAQCSK